MTQNNMNIVELTVEPVSTETKAEIISQNKAKKAQELVEPIEVQENQQPQQPQQPQKPKTFEGQFKAFMKTREVGIEAAIKMGGLDKHNAITIANSAFAYMSDKIDKQTGKNRFEKCTIHSIYNCILRAVQSGLMIAENVAFLVPMKDSCTLQIGFEGYKILLHRLRPIEEIISRVVFKDDDFTPPKELISINDDQEVIRTIHGFKHIPKTADKIQKNVVGAYSIVKLKNEQNYMKYLSRSEIDKHAKNETMYKNWCEQMYTKQVTKMLTRELAKSFCTEHSIIDILGGEETKEMIECNKEVGESKMNPDIFFPKNDSNEG